MSTQEEFIKRQVPVRAFAIIAYRRDMPNYMFGATGSYEHVRDCVPSEMAHRVCELYEVTCDEDMKRLVKYMKMLRSHVGKRSGFRLFGSYKHMDRNIEFRLVRITSAKCQWAVMGVCKSPSGKYLVNFGERALVAGFDPATGRMPKDLEKESAKLAKAKYALESMSVKQRRRAIANRRY